MIVNLTFFVQIINFLIGYWIVKNFLFVPLLIIIEHEKLEHDKEQNKIQKLNDLVLQNKKILANNWNTFYQSKKSINFKNLEQTVFPQVKNDCLNLNENNKLENNIINLLCRDLDDK